MGYLQYIPMYLLLLAFVCVERGRAIRCYDCNSHNDTRCAKDDLPADMEVDCNTKSKDQTKTAILCRKIKQIIDFEVNGLPPDTRVIRSCGWDDSNYKNRCYHRSGFGGRQEVCACEDDLCNGSNGLRYSTHLAIALTIYALINAHL